MIIELCRFFRKLPSEILAEDAEMLQLLKLNQLGEEGKGGSDG